MMIVGLTGGIGTGKSTVAGMFQDLGVPVYDSDAEAKHLMHTSVELKSAITKLLGEKSYRGNILNRSFIANQVFENPDKLRALNKIVHPAVKRDFVNWTKNQQAPYVIQETALIFENGSQDQYDHVILITAPTDLRVNRVTIRDGLTKEEVMGRMRNQLEDSQKLGLAHFHIANINLEITREMVVELHQKLIKLAN
ncbi:MAG: dephospho-CoA kinase [Flavobacteriaceae bacterium]